MKRWHIFFAIFLWAPIFAPQTHAQQTSWAVVMTENTGITDQIWNTRVYFPRTEINNYWNQGYKITSLTYANGLWAVVMSKADFWGIQNWVTDKNFPEAHIQKKWGEGYDITHLCYGNGVWAVIMSQNTGYEDQIWRTTKDFPSEVIEEFGNKGYYITNLDYSDTNQEWALVMSKGVQCDDQIYHTSEAFPKSEIEEYWSKGYSITNLTYGNGNWALVMSKGIGWGKQMWRVDKTFPEKVINDYWAKTYYITGIYHGNYVGGKPNTPDVPVTYKPATLSWNIPYQNNTKVSKAEYNIRACVKTETELSSIKVMVNGVEAVDATRGFEVVPDNGCDQSIERKIKLNVGSNNVQIIVTNKGGTTTSETRTVVFEQKTNPNPNNNTPIATGEKRLALVIGNSTYTTSPLKNPVNDARSMETALKEVGFEVMKVENASNANMKKAIDEYGTKLKSGNYDVGMFFYAGHGLQVKGNNYLVPVDAKIQAENEIEYECVEAGRVLAKMESAGTRVNIIVLDACRDNPFERSWSRSTQGGGLATMDAPVGSIVCYATSPGKTASDGDGTNGLYTQELLTHLRTPNVPLEEVFKRVRIGVINKSGKAQVPWETSSLTGNFFFKK
jgi:hypothetical protein